MRTKKNAPTPKQDKWKDPFFANARINRGTKDQRPKHLRRARRKSFKDFWSFLLVKILPWIANPFLAQEKKNKRVKMHSNNIGKHGYRPSQKTLLRTHARKS